MVLGNKTEQFKLKFQDIIIKRERISKLIGNSDIDNSESFTEKIDELIELAANNCSIQGGFVFNSNIEIVPKMENISVNGEIFSIGRVIASCLKKSESIAFFLCTAGPEVENLSKELMDQGELLEGYILDIIGSEIVEEACDKLQEKLEEKVNRFGLNITNRYSPGYCEWNVSEQHKLFSFFPKSFCGVTLSGSAFMTPKKSVSGIIGIGRNVKKQAYACEICDQRDCIYRDRA